MPLLKILLLPPTSLILACVVGLVLVRRRPRAGRALAAASAAALVLLMVPWVAAALLRSLQTEPPLRAPSEAGADAIVILAADFALWAPEFASAQIGPLTLERLRYGAHLARETELPVLVTGGALRAGSPPVASLMAESLRDDFGIEPRWIEDAASTTRGNARRSSVLLDGDGARRVLLVTHAWHLPRARGAFEAAGLDVVGAPTAFHPWPANKVLGCLPSARSLRESTWALHEWLGRAWYALTR